MSKFTPRTLAVLLAASFALIGTASEATPDATSNADRPSLAKVHPFGWDRISPEARPATFWWWLGSSVNEQEIRRQMRSLHSVGFGAVLVCPLYDYKNPTIPPVSYLSDSWVTLFKVALEQGRELGMPVDMTMGSGWPMGGPWITRQNAERYLRFEKRQLEVRADQPARLSDEPGKDPIVCVSVVGDDPLAHPATVIKPEEAGGIRVWDLPTGRLNVLITRMGYTHFDLYVAGPGGMGPVFDYWSEPAFDNLAKPFDSLLEKLAPLRPRAAFCDSFEGRGGATPAIFDEFEQLNGYDLRPLLHQLLVETGSPENARVWHDYRQTIGKLHVDFTRRWTAWAHTRGLQTLYQWIGDPANPLDTCAACDIPDAAPAAVSAAHLTGKRLVSNETFTWGAGQNFIGSLDYFRGRVELDGGLLAGINHAVYHGTPFTPAAEPWPGPMYYAGASFSETQPWFQHLRYLNEYLARLQQTLQNTTPDRDVLILSSIHDQWFGRNEGEWRNGQPLVWRNSENGVLSADKVAGALLTRGLQSDCCSDRLLLERVQTRHGLIQVGDVGYRFLVVPPLTYVEPATLKKLEDLARAGAPIVFVGEIPRSVPRGLPLVQDTQASSSALGRLINDMAAGGNLHLYRVADSPDQAELVQFLLAHGFVSEGGPVALLRARYGYSIVYLARNRAESRIDVWLPLSRNGRKVLIGNPRTQELAFAQCRPRSSGGTEVHLVMQPSEMLVLKVGDGDGVIAPEFDYSIPGIAKAVCDSWRLTWKDYQGLPHEKTVRRLDSWPEIEELGLFSGLVRYETRFRLEDKELQRRWLLDAGRVHESAEVYVNGRLAGGVWTTPFVLELTEFLKPGENVLVMEVANLAQNRIVDLQRRKVAWKRWPLEENDFAGYCGTLRLDRLQPLPSGLLGPVKLLDVGSR